MGQIFRDAKEFQIHLAVKVDVADDTDIYVLADIIKHGCADNDNLVPLKFWLQVKFPDASHELATLRVGVVPWAAPVPHNSWNEFDTLPNTKLLPELLDR